MSELVLATSTFKAAISEVAHANSSLASSGHGLTFAITGKVAAGSNVTDNGVIMVVGTTVTIGAAVSIILTPTLQSDGKVSWMCGTNNNSAQFKYVPAECRH